jgi:hypothetical protein
MLNTKAANSKTLVLRETFGSELHLVSYLFFQKYVKFLQDQALCRSDLSSDTTFIDHIRCDLAVVRKHEGNDNWSGNLLLVSPRQQPSGNMSIQIRNSEVTGVPSSRYCTMLSALDQIHTHSCDFTFMHTHQYGYIHRVNVTLLINDYQFNINSISMYYNQTILNSDRYSLYITIIKSDNNMTTEALKHYKGERARKRGRER